MRATDRLFLSGDWSTIGRPADGAIVPINEANVQIIACYRDSNTVPLIVSGKSWLTLSTRVAW